MNIPDSDCKEHPHTWDVVVYISKDKDEFFKFSDIERDIQFYLSIYEGHFLNDILPY